MRHLEICLPTIEGRALRYLIFLILAFTTAATQENIGAISILMLSKAGLFILVLDEKCVP